MKRFSEHLTASAEALFYKGTSPLYSDLQAIYQDAVAGDSAALARVAKAVQHHTHINFSVQLLDHEFLDARIFFLPFDVNSVLRDSSFTSKVGEKYQLASLSAMLSGKGGVDSKGRVNGVFTKFPVRFALTKAMLSQGVLTADELAALTLHEIGHVYHYFDTIGLSIASSAIISATLAILNTTSDLTARTHAIESAVKELRFENVDIETLAPEGEEKAFEGVMIRHTVLALAGDQGKAQLFNGEAEFLADSYAVRMGASQALVSGYMKLARAGGDLQVRSRADYILVEACKVALILASALSTWSLVPMALIAALSIAFGHDRMLNRDTPIERLEAVHGELVSILKDRNLPKEHQEALLTDIKLVSSLREQLTEHTTLVSYLWLTLSPARRRTYKQIQLQRDIGKMVNNDLFTKAAELTSLKGR